MGRGHDSGELEGSGSGGTPSFWTRPGSLSVARRDHATRSQGKTPLKLISDYIALWTVTGALIGYLFPPAFLIFQPVFLWLFAATMFALGTILDTADLRATLARPGRVVAGVVTQYTIMPLLGLGAAWMSGLPPSIALGFIIVGAAPGAMASNVIVYLAGGSLAFSIAMTTLGSVVSPLLTPLLVQVLGGAFMPVAFWPLMRTVLWTVLIPLLVGMRLQRSVFVRRLAGKLAPSVATIAIVIICSFAVASNQSQIATVGLSVFFWVVVVNALGYLVGWGVGAAFRFEHEYRLTLAIEIGMQNAGLGVALALAHFQPETALPGALFAAWCVLTAAVAARFLRSRRGDASMAETSLSRQ